MALEVCGLGIAEALITQSVKESYNEGLKAAQDNGFTSESGFKQSIAHALENSRPGIKLERRPIERLSKHIVCIGMQHG